MAILLESSDYNKLMELAVKNISESDFVYYDIISRKYSLPKAINNSKERLFRKVAEHKKDTPQNKEIFAIYKNLKDYLDSLDINNLPYDYLVKCIKDAELQAMIDCSKVK